MGEMADMYADMATRLPDWDDDGYSSKNRFDDFRDDLWVTKGGETISIKDMTDAHLLAAFKVFGDDRFRDEMIIRMFESMTKPSVTF